MKTESLGVDISKLSIDVYLYTYQLHSSFSNDVKGFKQLIRWIKISKVDLASLVICFEHTGRYSHQLSTFLADQQIDFVMESALQIKRSMGMVRGKNDQVDARRIAEYAYHRRNELTPTQLPSNEVNQIKHLLSLRENMVKQRGAYRANLNESLRVLKKSEHKLYHQVHKKLIRELDEQIKRVELEIKDIIQADQKLSEVYQLVTSVIGIGPVIGAYLITTTACFTKFDDSRKYACYCGTAPFEYQSGTSIQYRTKVNHLADKQMKALLNLAARSAITSDPELKIYYQRKVEEGKNKMNVLNAVRNKLLHRVFAVVKRGTPYVTLNKYAA